MLQSAMLAMTRARWAYTNIQLNIPEERRLWSGSKLDEMIVVSLIIYKIIWFFDDKEGKIES